MAKDKAQKPKESNPVGPAGADPSTHHHEKLPPYGDLSQAIYGVQLIIAHVRNGLVDGMPVDLACALHGGHAALGFGLSHVPHPHAGGPGNADAFDESHSEEELAGRLESVVPAVQDRGAGAPAVNADAIPWDLVVMIVTELIRRWLNR
jgi:hypothetical protein